MHAAMFFAPALRPLLTAVGLTAALAALGACETKNPYEQQPPGPKKPVKMIGVDPDKFDCKAYLSEADVAAAVGTPVTLQMPNMTVTEGTPPACIYAAPEPPAPDASPKPPRIDAGPSPAPRIWQVQLDCRSRAIADATAIMDGAKGRETTTTPAIGKRAVDHDGARLVFLDDDTACAGYVVGPDATLREALARVAAARLTEMTMPTRPRAVAL